MGWLKVKKVKELADKPDDLSLIPGAKPCTLTSDLGVCGGGGGGGGQSTVRRAGERKLEISVGKGLVISRMFRRPETGAGWQWR